jgi:hypothetical protein
MGIIFSPPFSIEDAIARGQDVYEVLFAGWGLTDAPPSTQFANMQFPTAGQPGIPSSVSGIAIGPKSTVDRCWVSYNPGKRRTANDPLQQENLLRALSVDSPLIFTQASPGPGVRNVPGAINDPVTTLADKGAFYIFPMADHPLGGGGDPITFKYPRVQATTVLPPTYTDVNGVIRTFNFVADTATQPRAMSPFLHLYLYLKQPPIQFIPHKRAPLHVQGSFLYPADSIGTEFIVAQIPTFGRRAIKVMMRGGAADFRVGALRAIGQEAAMFEQPVDQALAVPAGTPTVLSPCNECCHYADYTNLYITPTTNAVTGVTFQFTAYD